MILFLTFNPKLELPSHLNSTENEKSEDDRRMEYNRMSYSMHLEPSRVDSMNVIEKNSFVVGKQLSWLNDGLNLRVCNDSRLYSIVSQKWRPEGTSRAASSFWWKRWRRISMTSSWWSCSQTSVHLTHFTFFSFIRINIKEKELHHVCDMRVQLPTTVNLWQWSTLEKSFHFQTCCLVFRLCFWAWHSICLICRQEVSQTILRLTSCLGLRILRSTFLLHLWLMSLTKPTLPISNRQTSSSLRQRWSTSIIITIM